MAKEDEGLEGEKKSIKSLHPTTFLFLRAGSAVEGQETCIPAVMSW